MNPKARLKRKKGETNHHISYNPELIVKIPSKGSHLILTSFQSMGATKENIKYLDDFIKAVQFIKWQKENNINP